jgi:DinB family
MTYDDLRLLVDYNYWARDRILDAVSTLTPKQFTQPLGNSFSAVRDTIAHICDAESIWIRRWNGEQPLGFQNPERMPDVGHTFPILFAKAAGPILFFGGTNARPSTSKRTAGLVSCQK